MPVAVRNQLPSVAIFSDIPTKTAIEWAPKGSQTGEDIQMVPESILEHPKFLKAVGLGIFEVVSDDAEVQASILSMAKQYVSGGVQEKDALEALLDRATGDRDTVLTEDDLAAHIDAISKSQKSALDV